MVYKHTPVTEEWLNAREVWNNSLVFYDPAGFDKRSIQRLGYDFSIAYDSYILGFNPKHDKLQI